MPCGPGGRESECRFNCLGVAGLGGLCRVEMSVEEEADEASGGGVRGGLKSGPGEGEGDRKAAQPLCRRGAAQGLVAQREDSVPRREHLRERGGARLGAGEGAGRGRRAGGRQLDNSMLL